VRLIWLTDIHLNFVSRATVDAFGRQIVAEKPDAVLIGGDIGEFDSWSGYLSQLSAVLNCRIYFVLGNHDFYRSDITTVRNEARLLTEDSDIKWLPAVGPVALTPHTVLVGVDGWGDARNGNFDRSTVTLADFSVIRDVAHLPSQRLKQMLNNLGAEEGALLRSFISQAPACDHMLVLTHVPPFREACWHEGKPSDDEWVPFFSCKATGDVLLEAAKERPDTHITVLCGHSHGSGKVDILPNLHVRTGGARYLYPEIQRPIIEVS
jgi:predicted phosphohydrolase